MAKEQNPLRASPPKEVHLPKAPLVRVIAQVRFNPDLALENQKRIAPFQEKILSSYPTLEIEEVPLFPRPYQAAPVEKTKTIFRFYDISKAWRVSVCHDFLALETTAYSSRKDFTGRMEQLFSALKKISRTKEVQRIGIRYIDRVTGENLDQIHLLLRPEVSGKILALFPEETLHSIQDVLFQIPGREDHFLRARWGLLPPNKTVDPHALEPVPEKAWILDTDAFSSKLHPFDVEPIMATLKYLAERNYTFFRWAVSKKFLELFGGKP